MSKISELSDGGSLQSTDYLIAVRSGGNVKVRPNGAVSGTTGQFSTSLNVDGTVTADGLVIDTPASGAAATISMRDNTADSFVVKQGTNEYINVDTTNTLEVITLGNTTTTPDVIIPGGNVGIGTTSTGGYKFDVAGTARADSLSFRSDGSAPSGDAAIFRPAAGSIALATNSTERMRIDSSGNVAIGNTVAGAKLDIRQESGVAIRCEDSSGGYFVVNQGGTVGIGTSSPSDALVVEGNVASPHRIKVSNANASGSETLSFTQGSTVKSWVEFNNSTSNFDVWQYTNNALRFGTNNIERMRITSAGNVGIGTSNPVYDFVVSNGGAEGLEISAGGISSNRINTIAYNRSTSAYADMYMDAANIILLPPGGGGGNVGIGVSSPTAKLHILADTPVLMNNAAGTSEGKFDFADSGATLRMHNFFGTGSNITFLTNPNGGAVAERMRIDSSGNLLVGATSAILASKLTSVSGASQNAGAFQTTASTGYTALAGARNGNNGNVAEWWYDLINQVGTIAVTSTTTTYNTSSDARLKENIADAESASELIDAIKVRQFDWKADGSHQRYGMVAQELLEVAPEAVSQPEDPEAMMGVDYSKLVPMLVKEIQSLRARVAQLEGA